VLAERRGHMLALESYRSESFHPTSFCIDVFSIPLPSFMSVSCSGWVFLWGFSYFIFYFYGFCIFLLFHYCVVLDELQGMYLMIFGGAA
jgi:hypothetical protein